MHRSSHRIYFGANYLKNKTKLQTNLNNLFEDKACTTLKADIQALTDEALAGNEDFAALNADMKQMVLKVKNNTWQQFTNKSTGYTADYEKFFRVADYGIYSHDEEMANSCPVPRVSWPTRVTSSISM